MDKIEMRTLFDGSRVVWTDDLLTFEGDNFAGWIHDGWIGTNWSSNRITRIGHVDNNHLCCLTNLLSDANEFVRLHGESAEWYWVKVDSDICEL